MQLLIPRQIILQQVIIMALQTPMVMQTATRNLKLLKLMVKEKSRGTKVIPTLIVQMKLIVEGLLQPQPTAHPLNLKQQKTRKLSHLSLVTTDLRAILQPISTC